MKLLVFSVNYPNRRDESLGIFVYKLMQEFSNLGHQITVVSPQPITLKNVFLKSKYIRKDKVKVYQPLFLSFSNKKIFNFNTILLTDYFRYKAASKILKKERIDYDYVYCHFFSSLVMAKKSLSSLDNKKITLVAGETPFIKSIYKYKRYSDIFINDIVSNIDSAIALSTPLKNELIKLGVSEDKIFVSHNVADSKVFYKKDKVSLRKKYNIDLNIKIVLYVGTFENINKGGERVLSAISTIPNVYGVFLGKHNKTIDSDKVIFQGFVLHDIISDYMSIVDLLVLPTTNEGSCNTIAEAISCGLPIVSSQIPEIVEQCDPSFSILVNPLNVIDINNAIKSVIFNDNKLNSMSLSAIKSSKNKSLTQRAKDVINFIK